MRSILIIVFSAFLTVGKSQGVARPLIVSVFNEATGLPFDRFITTPIHPGIQVGSGFSYRERPRSNINQNINLAYVYHRKLFHGLSISTELAYDYKMKMGLNVKSSVGIGYLHTFTTQREYRLRNGVYKSERDNGNGHAMLTLGVGLGYRIKKNNKYSTEIFCLYQGWIEYPFSLGFIPFMAHTNLHLGIKHFIKRK